MPARSTIGAEGSSPAQRTHEAGGRSSRWRRWLKWAALQVPGIAKLHRQRETLRAETARQASVIAALTAERDGKIAECTRLASQLDAASTERHALQGEKARLLTEKDRLLGERERLLADAAGARIEAEAERAAAAAEHRRLAGECAVALERITALERERDALNGALGIARDEVAALNGDVGRLSARAIHEELVPTGPPRSDPADIAAASAAAAAEALARGPLVSIVCVCRNAEPFIARALASMQAQSYQPVELLVQDGASTDRTPDIARAHRGVKLASESDAAALDGLLRAARRAEGEIIAVCWADDELLPHAAGWAAAMFARHGGDVVYGDQLIVRPGGAEFIAEGAPWDRRGLLRQAFFPPFSSSFFRRSALLALAERLTVFDHDEFEFWLWLDRQGAIRHAPGLVSKFHVHSGSRWIRPGYCATMVAGRRRAIGRYAEALGEEGAALAAEAELGLELWAALHEISCAGSIPHSLAHFERILDRYDGDRRFLMILARLLNASKREGLAHAGRILAAARRLGFDVGVLAQRRGG